MWGRGTTGWGLNWLPESAASGEGEQRAGAQQRRAPRKGAGVTKGDWAGGGGARGAHEACSYPLPCGRDRNRSEAGGRRAHPQSRQVDVVQAAGGGWVAHGLRGEWGPGAAHAPDRLFRCRRRRFSPIGGSWGRTPPRLPQGTGRGRDGGRTDPQADRSYLSSGSLQPEPPDSPAQARCSQAPGGRTTERDASAPGSPHPQAPTPARRRRRDRERRVRGLGDRASLA